MPASLQSAFALDDSQSNSTDPPESTQLVDVQEVQERVLEGPNTKADEMPGPGSSPGPTYRYRPVFVFSTSMANTAADSVRLGAHRSLLEFHATSCLLAAALLPRHKQLGRRRGALHALQVARVRVQSAISISNVNRTRNYLPV